MGGGGTYYARDVTPKSLRTSRGFSSVAEEKMSRSKLDQTLLPNGRKLVCQNKNPVVYAFDVTGSMGNLPKIIFDKMPMMAGQLVERGYLEDPAISLAAIGDLICDEAPIQIGDFSQIRNLDDWLQKIYLEGHGGGQAKESYEFTAYFYARKIEIPNAITPIFLFTGDEGFREEIYSSDLKKYYSSDKDCENIDSKTIFEELKKKFKGDGFLIHRYYNNRGMADSEIVKQWEGILGEEKVIKLGDDLAIADTTLGLFAIVSGKCSLEEYLQDMKTRKQDPERVAKVKESLEKLSAAIKPTSKASKTRQQAKQKTEEPGTKPNKPGRL